MKSKVSSVLVSAILVCTFVRIPVFASEFNDELDRFNWKTGSSVRMPGPTSRSLDRFRDDENRDFRISVPFEKGCIDYNNILDGTMVKSGLKSAKTRKLFYKQLFLSLVLQQEINKYVDQNFESMSKLDNEMKKFRALKSLTDQAKNFLEYRSLNQVAFKDVQTTLPEWTQKIENQELARGFGELGSLLQGISYIEAISADAMDVMLLHSLATAEADERLEVLRTLVDEIPETEEPVLKVAFQEAEETYETIKKDRWSALKVAFGDLRTPKLVTKDVLLKAWEVAFKKIAHALAAKYGYAAIHSPAIAVVYLVELGVKLEGNYDLLREHCVATTFDYWLWKATDDWQKASDNETLKKQAMMYNLRSYLGFIEYEFLRDCYTADIFDPDFLLTWLYSFKSKDIVEGFVETRDRYINSYRLSLLHLDEIKPSSSEIVQSILLILDTSGSMGGMTGETAQSKLSAAVDAVRTVIRAEDVAGTHNEWALMVYDGCGRTPVAQHFSTDLSLIDDILGTLEPRGSTPLAYSLTQGAEYIWNNGRGQEGRIILLSDGGETCDGDPVEAARQISVKSQTVPTKRSGWLSDLLVPTAYAQGLVPIKIDVVGFDIQTSPEIEQLKAIAGLNKGRYIHVSQVEQLKEALMEIISPQNTEILFVVAFGLIIFFFGGVSTFLVFYFLRR